MGVFTYTLADITSPVAANRLFQALAIDNHNFMPKVVPHLVKSVEFVEGDSTTVGCVKQINLPDEAPFKYVKNRVDEIDSANFYLKYTCIGGDVFPDTVECAVYEDKYEVTDAGTRMLETVKNTNKHMEEYINTLKSIKYDIKILPRERTEAAYRLNIDHFNDPKKELLRLCPLLYGVVRLVYSTRNPPTVAVIS